MLLFDSELDCRKLPSLVNISVPTRHTRRKVLFQCHRLETNYEANSPIPRLYSLANEYSRDIDIFMSQYYIWNYFSYIHNVIISNDCMQPMLITKLVTILCTYFLMLK